MDSQFDIALQIASKVHAGKKDKGGKSYILHPLRIAYRLQTNDEELMAIGILHDTIEDSNMTFTELREAGISERVINALKLLTHIKGISYFDYIDAMQFNLDALKVKREDLRDNSDITRLKGISQKDVARMEKYQIAFLKVTEYIRKIEETV